MFDTVSALAVYFRKPLDNNSIKALQLSSSEDDVLLSADEEVGLVVVVVGLAFRLLCRRLRRRRCVRFAAEQIGEEAS